METRIPASERTSQKLSELLTQGVAEGDARSELIRLAVRKIVEESLEAEVAGAVGRGYYESGAVPGAGYRNGYRCGRLRTAEGPIDYGVPQVAGHQATARLQGPRERHPRRFVSSPRFRSGSRRSRAIASGDRLLEDLRLDLVRAEHDDNVVHRRLTHPLKHFGEKDALLRCAEARRGPGRKDDRGDQVQPRSERHAAVTFAT